MARHREWMAVNDTQQLNCSRGGTSGGPFFFKRPSASVLDSVKREHAPPIKKIVWGGLPKRKSRWR